MAQTLLILAMPPSGDGSEIAVLVEKARELSGPDVIRLRAQVLPDAAVRIALDLL